MAIEKIKGKYCYDTRVKATLTPADKKKLLYIKEQTGESESSLVAQAVNAFIKTFHRPSKHAY